MPTSYGSKRFITISRRPKLHGVMCAEPMGKVRNTYDYNLIGKWRKDITWEAWV
jgi:hypothetical protein